MRCYFILIMVKMNDGPYQTLVWLGEHWHLYSAVAGCVKLPCKTAS